ncbi:MAG TPA: hypothetical protein PK742_09965 [Chitinophagales bacterium]|nr:hypothetical protein [Bacteroidota bacterium]HQU76956.1 hypothetical protein [Chitinophagales bacterium]
MKRRKFIRNLSMAAAGAIAAPYILPSGRLFAASGSRLVNHVVLVLFGGGIRNQESVEQQYLLSQGAGPGGNVMRNMLNGAAPPYALVYEPWTPILPEPLANSGTLFKHMRYEQGPTGHFNGHSAVLTGHYNETSLNLNINPEYPTVFEYYRKHSSPARNAVNAWWLSMDLGPYPALNYSRHPDYGPNYGANYISPLTTFGGIGYDYFSTLNTLHPEELARLNDLRSFLDSNFDKSITDIPGIVNTAEDRAEIQQFIIDLLNGSIPVEYPLPGGVSPDQISGDLINITAAWQVLNRFEPELLVINTTNLDICHSDFSSYLSLLHRADYGVGWLWDKILSHPVLANDTIMICIPEHGRNAEPNAILDSNGLFAYDHTSDENSRDIFGLIVGPAGIVNQGHVIGSPEEAAGQAIDIVPTIAHILGFHDELPPFMLSGSVLEGAFV